MTQLTFLVSRWRSNSLAVILISSFLAACSGGGASEPAARDQSLSRLRERISTESPAESRSTRAVSEQEADSEWYLREASLLLDSFVYYGALPDDDPRVLGVFRMREQPDPIVDGDTIAVLGLDASLRLHHIDTEEVFRHASELRMHAYSDYESYVELMYETHGEFAKFGTPMGDLAREYTRQFFHGNNEARLEYDNLDKTRGYFNRFLVYVYALHDGQWVNYNLESVRAGMSPYFNKYGNSLRFHQEFLEAQAEARANQRGIWDPNQRHYPDYDQRIEWWNRRARAINHFEENYFNDPNYFDLSSDSEWERLNATEQGREITVFGTIAQVRFDWTPARVMLAHKITANFTLVGFGENVFEPYDFSAYRHDYIYVRGRLNFYQERPQFIVDNGIRIWMEP